METVINLWNAYAELLTGRPHDTITATGWVGVASVTGMIVLLVLPAAYYLASYPLRRLGRWWRGRKKTCNTADGIEYLHEVMCSKCDETYVWRSSDRHAKSPGCPMCRNRKFQLRLDAERRGQG